MYERTIKSACLAVICGLAALWNAAPAQAGLAVSPLKQEKQNNIRPKATAGRLAKKLKLP